jgi:hypothetical protein
MRRDKPSLKAWVEKKTEKIGLWRDFVEERARQRGALAVCSAIISHAQLTNENRERVGARGNVLVTGKDRV